MVQAGFQLTSSANLIGQLDAGSLTPIPNPSPSRCPGCQFREACTHPGDLALIDALYTRHAPKRDQNRKAA